MLRQSASRLLAAAALASTFVGCSVYQAATTDVGPSRGADSVRNDRLVAIGRTFEIQGKLDKAEQLYRLAVRRDPNDQEAMRRADYLTALRNGQMPSEEQSTPWSYGARHSYVSTSGAALSDPGPAATALPPEPTASQPVRTVSAETSIPEMITAETSSPEAVIEEVASSGYITYHSDEDDSATVALSPAIPYETAGKIELADSAESGEIIPAHGVDDNPPATIDVDAWMASPAEYQEELVAVLSEAQCDTDTRSLAAYLLSDVAPQDDAVSSALFTASQADPAEVVRLVSCESLLIRNAADDDTIAAVITAAKSSDESTRVQAILSMRHLAGTGHSERAVVALTDSLTDTSIDVRTMASATLGDFGTAASASVTALQDLAATDNDAGVRQACEAAIARIVNEGESASDEVYEECDFDDGQIPY